MLSFVFYTNRFISKLFVGDKFAGRTYGFIIVIKDKYRHDKGLLAHEKVHVRQFWENPILHGPKYLLSSSYRLNCEVQAYREQLKYSHAGSINIFADYIVKKYNLEITHDQALNLLRS